MLTTPLHLLLTFFVCLVYGSAGWFLYRNPVKVLDFVFKRYEFQYGRVGIGFFRVFGAVMLAQAGILVIASIVLVLMRAFGKEVSWVIPIHI